MTSGQHKVLGVKQDKTSSEKNKPIRSAIRAGIPLGMCDTTGEGLKSAADSNVAAKRRATVRAGNFFQARASPEEDDIFQSSHLIIWVKKAEWEEVIQRQEQSCNHKRLKDLRDMFRNRVCKRGFWQQREILDESNSKAPVSVVRGASEKAV